MDDNQARHEILKNIVFMNHDEMGKDSDPLIYSVEFLKLITYKKGDTEQRKKALRYLLSAGYLVESGEDDFYNCSITKKGVNAFNGEYFLDIHEEIKRKRTNNRWMIGTNVVLALGVFYSIFHDNFKCSEKVSDKTTSKTEQTGKKEYPVLNPEKTVSVHPLEGAKDTLKKN